MFYELQAYDNKVLGYFINYKSKLSKKSETFLFDLLLPEELCKYISNRAKSDTVIVAHDPTGSLVL